MSLTPRLREVLDAVAEHLITDPTPPTLDQLAARTGHSRAQVDHDVAVLQALGYLARDDIGNRPLRLLTPGYRVVPVAWCGPCARTLPADHTCAPLVPLSSKDDLDG